MRQRIVDLRHLDARQVKPGHRDTFHPHAIPDTEVVAGRFEVQMGARCVVLDKNSPAALYKTNDSRELDRQFLQTALVRQRADVEDAREQALTGGLRKQQKRE